jgi:hypothetical protein
MRKTSGKRNPELREARQRAEDIRMAEIEGQREAELLAEAAAVLQRRRIELNGIELAQLLELKRLQAPAVADLPAGAIHEKPNPILRPVAIRKRG